MSNDDAAPAADLSRPDARGDGATDHDIVVAGGGMVGALLAALASGAGDAPNPSTRAPLRICVLDEDLPEPFEPGSDPDHDIRVSALSVASRNLFEAVGAWQGVTSRRACPYTDMAVWDGEAGSLLGSGSLFGAGAGSGDGSGAMPRSDGGIAETEFRRPGTTRFSCEDIDTEALGWIVENRVIRLALLERLASLENVRVEAPARLVGYREEAGPEGLLVVTLEDGRELRTRLLVGADGARSTVRRLAGIGIEKVPYAQRALVATVRTAYGQRPVTWQRFMPTGPQAFLPLCGQRGSMVWYHSAEEIARLSALDDASFLSEMTRAFPPELGALTGVVQRASFPIAKAHAESYVAPRVALIGDAAHTVHPLAGQGVNLGMLDAGALAEVLLERHRAGGDVGTRRTLRRYERWRRGENALMIGVLDGFHRAFSPRPAPVRLLRRFALDAADRAGPVKRLVTRRAMGIEGDLPALARR